MPYLALDRVLTENAKMSCNSTCIFVSKPDNNLEPHLNGVWCDAVTEEDRARNGANVSEANTIHETQMNHMFILQVVNSS